MTEASTWTPIRDDGEYVIGPNDAIKIRITTRRGGIPEPNHGQNVIRAHDAIWRADRRT